MNSANTMGKKNPECILLRILKDAYDDILA